MCVHKSGGFFGNPFKTSRGTIQGGSDLTCLFNIVVDAIVWEWIHLKVGVKAIRLGMGEDMQRFLVFFYVDDGVLAHHNIIEYQPLQDIGSPCSSALVS